MLVELPSVFHGNSFVLFLAYRRTDGHNYFNRHAAGMIAGLITILHYITSEITILPKSLYIMTWNQEFHWNAWPPLVSRHRTEFRKEQMRVSYKTGTKGCPKLNTLRLLLHLDCPSLLLRIHIQTCPRFILKLNLLIVYFYKQPSLLCENTSLTKVM